VKRSEDVVKARTERARDRVEKIAGLFRSASSYLVGAFAPVLRNPGDARVEVELIPSRTTKEIVKLAADPGRFRERLN